MSASLGDFNRERYEMGASVLRRKKQDVDMTEGNILRHIINFAVPLLIGNLFQQLYNTVDTWVVGNFASDGFSAVGTVGPVINMLIGFFMGLSSGAGVIISQYYGAGKHEEVSRAVHTSIVMTLILGVIFTALGVLIVPLALDIMNTPDDVTPQASIYLTIYFSGIIGLMIYNMGSGILRAVGDSKRPFYFLVVAAIINTVLDLVFVIVFKLGVAGVAYATIISQGISAILVMVTLFRSQSCVRLSLRKLKLSFDILMKIVKVGFPAALQMAITSFSNVFVQSYINHFGNDVMSGWTAYSKIDQLLLLPMQSIALSSTTFVGQNLGKNQSERAKKGVRTALFLGITSTLILMVPVLIFAPYLVSFFYSRAEVIESGTLLLRLISPFYVLCCFNQIYAGALRGSGNTRAPMIIMLVSFVAFRQLYLFVVANFISNTIIWISMSYPAGWLLASALTMLYYKHTDLTSKVEIAEPKAAEVN